MDHFYLRSFQTGMMKIILNILSLGMWYLWDIIQVVYDGKKVREQGLSTPLDWVCGIGRGVFTSEKTDADPKKYIAEKSYLLYATLAIFLGFLGADKFYMGETWQGIAKILSVFNIFLFLFGILWVLWDAAHALFMTKDVLNNGIWAPMPYSFFFKEPIDGKQFLVDHLVVPHKDDGKGGDSGGSGFGGFSFNPTAIFNALNPITLANQAKESIEKVIPAVPIPVISYKGLYSDLVVPFMTPTVVAAINASKSTDPIIKMPELPDAPTMPGLAKFGLPTSLPTSLPSLPGVPVIPGVPVLPGVPAPPPVAPGAPLAPGAPAPPPVAPGAPVAPGVPAPPPVAPPVAPVAPAAPPVAPVAPPPQAGGGRHEFSGGSFGTHGGPGPVIAGVLTAVVLAGGLKGFYDVISKQYG